MVDKRHLLDEALSRGVITGKQRMQIEALAKEDAHDNEERIKPVGTFNEIFVTFGVFLLLGAVNGLVGLLLKQQMYASVVAVGTAWLAAIYFDERKRFRLPIIYACISAAIAIGLAIKLGLAGDIVRGGDAFFSSNQPLAFTVIPLIGALAVLVAGAWRFKIPFLMLPISILFTLIITYAAKYGHNDVSYRLLLGGAGLVILAIAVRFDLLDPKRVTRMSDFAFWSYVVGSPLFVHSLMLSVLLQGDRPWKMLEVNWVLLALLVAAVSFVGLLLNRRALILSTLVYVGFVISRLLGQLLLGGMGSGVTILFVTSLLIGCYVIALGSKWVQARRAVMSRLPAKWGWLKRLPPY